MLMFLSNHDPRFLTDVTGTILLSPTHNWSMFTLANCCLVPTIINSVLLSLRHSLSFIDWPRGVFACKYVNMVVTSRCCAFRALIMQAENWKSFLVKNSTNLLYSPIPSSAEIFTDKLCQFFFAQDEILNEKNPYFGKHLSTKQEPITRARLRVQDW